MTTSYEQTIELIQTYINDNNYRALANLYNDTVQNRKKISKYNKLHGIPMSQTSIEIDKVIYEDSAEVEVDAKLKYNTDDGNGNIATVETVITYVFILVKNTWKIDSQCPAFRKDH